MKSVMVAVGLQDFIRSRPPGREASSADENFGDKTFQNLPMRDIITIGSATLDVFLISNQFKFVRSKIFSTGIGECVPFGSKIEVAEIVRSTGGGATNAAATFRNLGFATGVLCRVGRDSAAQDVIQDLKKYRLDTGLIKQVQGETGYSTLLTDKRTGERSIMVYRGVSAHFSPADIAWSRLQARWIYLTSLGGNVALVKKIVAHCARHRINLAWNPGSADIKTDPAAIRRLLPKVKILLVNQEEGRLLTGETAPVVMLTKLATRGNIVIVSSGSRGADAIKDGVLYHSGTTGVKAVSRTGAGDAFGSGFTAALMKYGDVARALQVGTVNAESVIKIFGAKTGLLSTWPKLSQTKKIKVSIKA
jgi:sugar/nucleoside kinase (ribokinase family)